MAQSRGLVHGSFAGRSQLIVDGQACFVIESRDIKRFFIPADGGLRNSFIEEALSQPGVGLDGLRKWLAAFDRGTDFLQFGDGFVEQAHFAEGNAQTVMRFRVVIAGRNLFFEGMFQLAEHLRKIDAVGGMHGLGSGSQGAHGSRAVAHGSFNLCRSGGGCGASRRCRYRGHGCRGNFDMCHGLGFRRRLSGCGRSVLVGGKGLLPLGG